ncbi:hypothetical protein CJ030_MR3G009479 [Morella rubra]|uniref:Uncharacterized protein n=1 Tax=Morella rubra TaxID=262757 RepID=A0A6A1W6W8_9ROSI|nr:hypothetical protein CJ030_MR3G009479 [Morella rubra]
MGFVQNDDGEWVKKGVVTPQKGGDSRSDSEEEDDEDEEEADTERTPQELRLLWRFGALDKEMRGLKHQVNNSIHVTRNVFQQIVDEFASTSAKLQASVKSSAQDVEQATMDILVLHDLDGLAEEV